MHITIYTRYNCIKCEDLIEDKLKNSYSYTEEVINGNIKSMQDFKKHGFKYVPAIVVKNEKGRVMAKGENLNPEKFEKVVERAIDRIRGER